MTPTAINESTRSIAGSLSPRLAAGVDRHAIVAHRRLRRNIAGVEVALDEVERPPTRLPVAAPAAGLDYDEVAGCERKALFLLDRSLFAGSPVHDREAAGLGFLAALRAPGRK